MVVFFLYSAKIGQIFFKKIIKHFRAIINITCIIFARLRVYKVLYKFLLYNLTPLTKISGFVTAVRWFLF